DSGGNSNQQRNHDRKRGELDRDRQLLENQRENRPLQAQRFAEIAVEDSADPVVVANGKRFVQVQLLVQIRDDVRVALFAREDHGRIARQQLLQREYQYRHEDQRRNDRRDSADEKGEHRMALEVPLGRSTLSVALSLPLAGEGWGEGTVCSHRLSDFV